MSLAIIVPMLNEAAGIGPTLAALRELDVEIVAVDGGSSDKTVGIASATADQVLVSARGRARQMNAGAAATQADILLFLHADTALPSAADQLIRKALAHDAVWGRFDVRISGNSRWFPLIAALMNLRSRLTGIATGDQAIFVKRSAFEQIGGFADLPLMEDIVLSQRLKTLSRPACLHAKVTTAGRRWEKHGVLRTILTMWWLRLRFFFGADPQKLAKHFLPLCPERNPLGGQGGDQEVDGFVAASDTHPHPNPPLDGEGAKSPTSIAILSRAPLPGQTKTRLIPALGAQGAADLHQRFLLRTLQTAFAAQLGPLNLWCSPDTTHPAFAASQQLGPLTLHTQSSGDLGARMLATLAANTPTLIIGTDCPALTPEHLQLAAAALNEHDAVLIPAADGGYVLIGLRQPDARLFANIAWGGATVLAETRHRLRDAGLSWLELPTLWDVDEAADLTRLAAFAPELLKPI